MSLLNVAMLSFGPRFPRWAFTFDADDEERAEALDAFGEPYGVVATAQIQISREEGPPMPPAPAWLPDGWPWTAESWARYHRVYTARVVSWDFCGPVRAGTIAGLVQAYPGFRR